MLALVLSATSKAGIMFGPGKEHMAEHGAALAQKVRESQMVLHVDEVLHIAQCRKKLMCLQVCAVSSSCLDNSPVQYLWV